jgi:hypothetical protein
MTRSADEPLINGQPLTDDQREAWRRYSSGDPFWLARDQPHVQRMRQALVDCAAELRAVPSPDDYRRWRNRQMRRGRVEATIFMIELSYPRGWDSALYDAGIIKTAPENFTACPDEPRLGS